MTKCAWFLALFLIILAAACGDKSGPTAPMADTPENRKAAAKHYLEAVPPEDLLKNITGNMIQKMPEPTKKQFLDALADKELLKHVSSISENTLVKHFTPNEMNAMAAFFGSPEGKSARAKFTPYMTEMLPQISEEVKKVFAKVQEQTNKDQPKEGAAKPEPPKAEQPKPTEAKPAKPEPPQPKPEKPEVKQPKAEQPKNK